MSLKRHTQFAIALLLAGMAAVPAVAQNSRIYRDSSGWVEEVTGSLPQTRSLKVTTDIGTIQVNGGNDSEIKYTIKKHSFTSSEESARRAFQQFEVKANRRGDVDVVEGGWADGHVRKFNAEFILEVPRNLQLVKLNTDGGAIRAAALRGRLEAETGGGTIHLDDVAAVSAETGGGTINVGNASGELKLTTGGGSIHINNATGSVSAESGGGSVSVGSAAGAKIETGGGSVKVERCSGHANIETGGGMIDLGDVNGSVTLETGGGNIRISSAKGPVRVSTGGGTMELWKLADGVRAETGAGSITAELVSTPQGASSIETTAGDLTVYVAPSVKLTIQAEIDMAAGHKINSDFPDLKITSEGGDYGPKTITATGNLNGGGPVLKLETTIGNINIRRGNQ